MSLGQFQLSLNGDDTNMGQWLPSNGSYFDDILSILKNNEVSLGQFLQQLFDNKVHHLSRHGRMVQSFLSGRNIVKPVDILRAMYSHRFSTPSDSRHPERKMAFSIDADVQISYCAPAYLTWALHTVLSKVDDESDETCDSKKSPELRVRASRVSPPMNEQVPQTTPDGLASQTAAEHIAALQTADGPMQSEAAPQSTQSTAAPASRGPGRPVGAVSKDRLITWDIVNSFSADTLVDKYCQSAPVIWSILNRVAGDSVHVEPNGSKYRPREMVCIGTMSELIFARNQSVNLFPMVMGVTLFASRAHQTIFRICSRRGFSVPYSTTMKAMETMADASRNALKTRYSTLSPAEALANDITFDNVQHQAKSRDHRIGVSTRMVIGTAATSVELQNCAEHAFDLDKIIDAQKANLPGRRELDADTVLGLLDDVHYRSVFVAHWVDILVTNTPALQYLRPAVTELFQSTLEKHPIDPERKTRVDPLGTNSANEVSTKGLQEALRDFAEQIGLQESTFQRRGMFFHGDGKSFEGMLSAKRNLAGEESALQSFLYIIPILAMWHTKWHALCRIIECLWGDAEKAKGDPTSFAYMCKLLNVPAPSDLSKLDFHAFTKLLQTVVSGHVLHCWESFLKRAEARNVTTIDELISIANQLHLLYSKTESYYDALGSSVPGPRPTVPTADGRPPFPRVFPAEPKKDNSKLFHHPDADWALANSIILMRDGIEYLESCRAVATGDSGRAWEIYKRWIFSFEGGGNTNLSVYLIEMLCMIEFELPAATRHALFDNWFVNLPGKPGHFHERDLMQERFNFWLEELAKHKGKEFDDKWYRNVISMHVQHFLNLKGIMESEMGLTPRQTGHTDPPTDNEIAEVLRVCRQNHLHSRRNGRCFGTKAEDHHTMGYTTLGLGGRLDRHVERSLRQWDSENKQLPAPAYEDLSVYLRNALTVDENGQLVIDSEAM